MSFGELLFLALLALLVFGPRKLPEMARSLAKIMAELRRASNEFRYTLEDEIRNMDVNEPPRPKRLDAAPADTVTAAPADPAPDAAAGSHLRSATPVETEYEANAADWDEYGDEDWIEDDPDHAVAATPEPGASAAADAAPAQPQSPPPPPAPSPQDAPASPLLP